MDSLHELFVDELKDLWSAENQLTKALPKMAKGASTPELATAFKDHLEVTKQQLQRIEDIFANLDASPRGKKCMGMEGLIKEGAEVLKEDGDEMVIDAGLIAAAQKVEHYEISAYGSVIAHAKLLGMDDAVEVLAQSLAEEKEADELLNSLAEETVNPAAAQAESEEAAAE